MCISLFLYLVNRQGLQNTFIYDKSAFRDGSLKFSLNPSSKNETFKIKTYNGKEARQFGGYGSQTRVQGKLDLNSNGGKTNDKFEFFSNTFCDHQN